MKATYTDHPTPGLFRAGGKPVVSRLIVLLALVTITSCSYSVRPIYKDEEKKTTERAVALIHGRINAEQYGEIYDDAHDSLKNAGSREAFIAGFKEARELTGKIKEVKHHWEKVFTGAPVEVRAIYNVSCERGDFEELFTFIVRGEGETAQLANYSIHPGSTPPAEMEEIIRESERSHTK